MIHCSSGYALSELVIIDWVISIIVTEVCVFNSRLCFAAVPLERASLGTFCLDALMPSTV